MKGDPAILPGVFVVRGRKLWALSRHASGMKSLKFTTRPVEFWSVAQRRKHEQRTWGMSQFGLVRDLLR